MNSNRLRIMASLAVCAASVLAGCAGGQVKKSESLSDRAVARWTYLVNQDPGSAWGYMTPGARAITTKNQYITETLVKPVHWTSVKFLNQECQSDTRCDVTLDVGFSMQSHLSGVGKIESSSFVKETWILTDGNWFYLPPER